MGETKTPLVDEFAVMSAKGEADSPLDEETGEGWEAVIERSEHPYLRTWYNLTARW